MNILGYGEDGLTLAFFCNSFQAFLDRLSDTSDPHSCTIYYRASFGRGSGFGELDAVVVTPDTVYLCESKWNDRERSEVRKVQLNEVQVRRNKVFREIIKAWLCETPLNWADFRDQHAAGFQGFRLPVADTTLAKNLSSILRGLEGLGHKGDCKNVLIYFYRADMMDDQPLCVTNHEGKDIEYNVVKVKYAYGDSGSHFERPSQLAEGAIGLMFCIERSECS